MSEKYPDNRDDLLTPVLDTEPLPVPAYSTRAQFFTAFFGGPFAIILFSGLNAYHMGRLNKDAWRYALITILSVTVVVLVVSVSVSPAPPAWLTESLGGDGSRVLRWGSRLLGLLVWLALWAPYRRYHKAAEIMGAAPRNPWLPAIVCVGGAVLANILIYGALTEL